MRASSRAPRPPRPPPRLPACHRTPILTPVAALTPPFATAPVDRWNDGLKIVVAPKKLKETNALRDSSVEPDIFGGSSNWLDMVGCTGTLRCEYRVWTEAGFFQPGTQKLQRIAGNDLVCSGGTEQALTGATYYGQATHWDGYVLIAGIGRALYGNFYGIYAHELGHQLGLAHASAWVPTKFNAVPIKQHLQQNGLVGIKKDWYGPAVNMGEYDDEATMVRIASGTHAHAPIARSRPTIAHTSPTRACACAAHSLYGRRRTITTLSISTPRRATSSDGSVPRTSMTRRAAPSRCAL